MATNDSSDASAATRGALTGRWRRQVEQSDMAGLDKAMDLMEVNFIVRTAGRILKCIELRDTEESFSTVIKAGGILDVRETFPWSGEAREHPRRDKRRGKATGRVYHHQKGICVHAEFGGPKPGEAIDYYALMPDGRLKVESIVNVHGGGSQTYNMLYMRD